MIFCHDSFFMITNEGGRFEPNTHSPERPSAAALSLGLYCASRYCTKCQYCAKRRYSILHTAATPPILREEPILHTSPLPMEWRLPASPLRSYFQPRSLSLSRTKTAIAANTAATKAIIMYSTISFLTCNSSFKV